MQHDPAVVQQGDRLAEVLDEVELVAREQQVATGACVLGDHVREEAAPRAGSRPANGSSSTRSSGPWTIAAASCTRCAMPPERAFAGTATMDAAIADAIQNDRAYVNVHTPTNPAGEIRDQVAIVATVKTTLRASQERPRPKGKVSEGEGAVPLRRSRGVAPLA